MGRVGSRFTLSLWQGVQARTGKLASRQREGRDLQRQRGTLRPDAYENSQSPFTSCTESHVIFPSLPLLNQ